MFLGLAWLTGTAVAVGLVLAASAAQGDQQMGYKGDATHLAPAEVEAMRQSMEEAQRRHEVRRARRGAA